MELQNQKEKIPGEQGLVRVLKKELLELRIFETRALMGAAAALNFFQVLTDVLKEKEEANIIFASAPSQNEFLDSLLPLQIEWNRVNAFHMDEYIGLDAEAEQGFANFLKARLFNKINLKSAHYLNGSAADVDAECQRYASLLTRYPTDIVCLGIGENTHLAFNDPHVAHFDDQAMVKVVDLDIDCRQQQVNDACFKHLGEVPKFALTLTIPALMKARYAFPVVPGKKKADAISHTVHEEISERYPSTILKRHEHAIAFLDLDSSAGLTSDHSL